MENETNDKRKKWEIRPSHALFVGIGILIVGLSSLYGLRVLQSTVMSKQLDANLPPYGWTVSEDLGVGEVPGGPTAQRFVVEQIEGWEVLAYCLDPQEPPPPVGTTCELIDENTFWCGDDFQQLREYEIVQQPPPPAPTETVQPSATRTSTSTPTSTPTYTPTSTPTSTPTATNTATSTATTKPTNISAAAKTSTPTPRPKMGGDGNLRSGDVMRFVLGLVFISISGILMAIEGKRFLTQRHKK